MEIRNIKLLNFRNYEKLELTFSNSFNIIYGLNGMGKTNLIEAIYVLALTKSFRGSTDKVLIKENKNLAKIEANVFDKTLNNYKIVLNNQGKKVKENNNSIDKLSNYISKICVVLFNPDDLRMIKDSPSIRRKMINVEMSQLNNNYLKYLNLYNKILKQRNSYLKTIYLNANSSKDYLEILNNKLIEYGMIIFNERKKFVELLNKSIKPIFSKIDNANDLIIEYYSNFMKKNEKKLLEEYHKALQKDMALGKTTIGIHHDDFIFKLNNKNIKDFGSEGQQKNAIIALKIAEIEIFKAEKKINPILILDDLFSHLDQEKINNILNLVNKNIQTFITTTEIDNVSDEIINQSKRFVVEEGNVREIL